MKLLDKSMYYKVIPSLMEITINNLFARSVIEQRVNGLVYTDNIKEPGTFYIIHPYGMSLLFGGTNNDVFNSNFLDYALNKFKTRQKDEWLQAFPDKWNKKLHFMFKDYLIKPEKNNSIIRKNKIEINTRVNFKFNKEKYVEFVSNYDLGKYKIVRTNEKMYENMKGSVVPKYFWNNSIDFINNGIGYSLILENNIVSTAFSSFIHDGKLELGIETAEGYKGKGLAIHTCSALINYCLEQNYEPIWACRLENTGSFKLAQKLGFEQTLYLPYYRLKV